MKKLTLKNFKSFKEETIYFENLTVLAGGNGAGKSTVIQSLLILMQSFNNKKETSIIPFKYYINDYYCELGSTINLLNKDANEDFIEFVFYDKDNNYTSLQLKKDIKDTTVFNLNNFSSNESDLKKNKSLNFLKYGDFIGADRFGPKTFHHTDSNFSKINVGKYGEYTPFILNMYKDEILFVPHPIKKTSSSLLTHVNLWLEKIFGFVNVEPSFIEEANIAILKIKNDQNGIYHTPVNMPYGISYVLPIIVSCLIRLISKSKLFENFNEDTKMEESELIIIENPEAHLHPSAQSMLGVFLAYIANHVQIIVETHSDHILNGIRKAIKEKMINNKEVIVNFFELEKETKKDDDTQYFIEEIEGKIKIHLNLEKTSSNNNHTKITSIDINENGELEIWPKGFFDQFEKDMMELL